MSSINSFWVDKLTLASFEADTHHCLNILDGLVNDATVLLDFATQCRKSIDDGICFLESYGIAASHMTREDVVDIFCEDDDEDGEKKGIFTRIWDRIKRMFTAVGKFISGIFRSLFGKEKDIEITPKRDIDKELLSTTWTLCKYDKVDKTIGALERILQLVKDGLHTSYDTLLTDTLLLDTDVDKKRGTSASINAVYSREVPAKNPALLNLVKLTKITRDGKRIASSTLEWNPKIEEHCKVIGITLPEFFKVELGWAIVFSGHDGSKLKDADYDSKFTYDISELLLNKDKPISLKDAGFSSKATLTNAASTINRYNDRFRELSDTINSHLEDIPDAIERTHKKAKKVAKSKTGTDLDDVKYFQELLSTANFALRLATALVRLVVKIWSTLYKPLTNAFKEAGVLDNKTDTK